jgi:hypothetical protein
MDCIRPRNERANNLKLNEYLRVTDGTRDPEWGRWALSIPVDDHAALVKLLPDLQSHDAIERTKAWAKFMASPLSLPYRVTEKI